MFRRAVFAPLRSRLPIFKIRSFQYRPLVQQTYNYVTITKKLLPKKRNVRDVVPYDKRLPQQPLEIFKTTAFCVAEGFDLPRLLPHLQQNFILLPFITEDALHLSLDSPMENEKSEAEAFVFSNGAFVTWGASKEQIERLRVLLAKGQVNPHEHIESESFDYYYDPEQSITVTPETIVLGSDFPINQAKLALSSGLARSAKLAVLEEILESHLDKHKEIPHVLLQGKKPQYSRSQVLQAVGELFVLRGQLNLHSELLDSPDFCWSSSRMEELFDKISRQLDVRLRIAIFNKKLDYAKEVAEVLKTHKHEMVSLNLEWAIIALISLEILFELMHYAERFGYIRIPRKTA